MRWTTENKEILLLKIIETHNLSIDTDKVAAHGTDEKPTPRAITEQLKVILKNAKSSAGSDEQLKIINKATSSAPSTPKKGRKSATPGSTKTPGSGKRKRSENQNEQVDKLDKDDALVVSRGVEGTPSKRSRKSSTLPAGMVIYDDQQNSDALDCESSVSDYVPDESAVKDEDFEM